MTPVPLIKDPMLLERLEKDLIEKACTALDGAQIAAQVLGVFSLDELESKNEKELGGLLAVGVGYLGCRSTTTQENTAQSQGRAMNEYRFMILFAAPVDDQLSQRVYATTLLSTLRRGVLGSHIRDDATRTQRTWQFVEEQPVINESTRTMLYYTQVWRVALPAVAD